MNSYENNDFIAGTNRKISHYGVYSVSMLGLSKHYVFYNIGITGISLDPPYHLGGDRTKDLHILSSDWKMEMYNHHHNNDVPTFHI